MTRPVDQAAAEWAVTLLLRHVGEDAAREGLLETPRRVVKAWKEMTDGYDVDIPALLATTFDGDSYDEMIVVRDVSFVSLCEHHVLPFTGSATVGYLPGDDGRVVGLSKLARLVEAYARRLQVQERMTRQIADALDEHLKPAGVGVVLKAAHSCMACRGVRKPGAEMVTSTLLGRFREQAPTRAEFLAMCS